MARLVRRRWIGERSAGLSRKDSRSCDYEAYVPDALAKRAIALAGDVAADVADAQEAIARLDASATALADTEAIARLLLRAESVASSRIEGLEIGARRLLRAEAAQALGEASSDVTATEILANIEAMRFAVRSVRSGAPITVQLLLQAHARLTAGTPIARHGGWVRTEQNWIGGSPYNPCSASYVPPPHELVTDLLADLCAFCNEERLPAVAQAALAHAQFEAIHPFADGNGRTGRALIHMVLRRRGLASRVLPPVSLVLATQPERYIEGLRAMCYHGPANGRRAREATNEWIGFFASACRRAVDDSNAFEARVAALQAGWRRKLGPVRVGSATDLLLRALPGAPLITVKAAADLTGRSAQAANEAVRRLEAAGVIRQVGVGRRNRAFEAPSAIAGFAELERRLAIPDE